MTSEAAHGTISAQRTSGGPGTPVQELGEAERDDHGDGDDAPTQTRVLATTVGSASCSSEPRVVPRPTEPW